MADSRRMLSVSKVFGSMMADGKQIVYVSIMGTVMCAAFLEWFLWLAAFLYCLIKVYKKAEHWSIKLLAVAMMIGFSLLRYTTDATDQSNSMLNSR